MGLLVHCCWACWENPSHQKVLPGPGRVTATPTGVPQAPLPLRGCTPGPGLPRSSWGTARTVFPFHSQEEDQDADERAQQEGSQNHTGDEEQQLPRRPAPRQHSHRRFWKQEPQVREEESGHRLLLGLLLASHPACSGPSFLGPELLFPLKHASSSARRCLMKSPALQTRPE